MTQQNLGVRRMKKLGTYSITDNKVRVKYNDAIESVLFEDISSISYIEIKTPNHMISLLFTFIAVILIILGTSQKIIPLIFFSIIVVIVGFILMFAYSKKWDNVIIETRGGKEIIYTVESGNGEKEMEKIEHDRRKQSESIQK